MSSENFIINLVIILGAAVFGGMLALLLKQPVILGYIIGGLIVGPFTPGLVVDFDQLRFLAEVGVALLLFSIGANTTRSRFQGLGGVIIWGGTVLIIWTIGLGILSILLLGFSLAQGFLLGIILHQGSTAVITKVLEGRKETDTVHGRIAFGISLVEDVSSVPLLLLFFVFADEESANLLAILGAMGKVFGLAIGAYLIGRIFLPRILDWFGRLGSDELTLIITLFIAVGGALAVQAIGMSFAIGAFLAGLAIAESKQKPSALLRIMPLRDVFVAMFFVSIGTLFNPSVIWHYTLWLLGLLGVIVIGNATAATIMVRLFKYTLPVAVLSGLLLGQIGEFSFILANIGLEHGAIPQTIFSIVITAAVISISINSLVLDSAPPVLNWLAKITRFMPLSKRYSASIATVVGRRLKREDLVDNDTDIKLKVEDTITRWSHLVYFVTSASIRRRRKGPGEKLRSIENNGDKDTNNS